MKEGTKGGTYKLMVKASAAEAASTKTASKTVTVKVKVTAMDKAANSSLRAHYI